MTPTLTSLQYNVSQLLKSEVGSTRAYDFEADGPLDLDDGVAHDIRGHVRFMLTNFGIVAVVQAHAVLDLNCARCVEPFELPVDISFDDEYQPLIDIATGLPSDTPRSDAAFSISQNHTIDLGEAIRQHLLLSVELIPLCSRDCRGLCPTCGVNLNQQACTCPPAEEPSPFAVLQGLFGGSESDH
jgi:uncharacterized protein